MYCASTSCMACKVKLCGLQVSSCTAVSVFLVSCSHTCGGSQDNAMLFGVQEASVFKVSDFVTEL